MESRWSLAIAGLALVISFLSLFHSFVTSEFGVVFGKEDYDISIKDRFRIYNTAGPLVVSPHIVVRNDGTIPLRINKARALLQLGSEKHWFYSSFTKTVPAQNVWNYDIELGEKLTDEDLRGRDELNMDIANYMLSQFHSTKDPNAPIFLDSALMDRLGKILDSNVDWMREDGNYYLLLMFWVNKDERIPSIQLLYKFKFTTAQRQMLTEFQKKGYYTPNSDIYSGNKFISFHATPLVTKIEDQRSISHRYLEYEKLAED